MSMYAKLDQNIQCGSTVISILPTVNEHSDRQTDRRRDSHSDYSADVRIYNPR